MQWAVLAENALIDTTGKVSLIGIFNKLWAGAFPGMHPALVVVAAWSGDPSYAYAIELRMWGPSGDLILTGQQQIQIGEDGQAWGVFQLAPIPLPAPGHYTFELISEGISQVHVPLEVVPLPTEDGLAHDQG